MLPRISTAEKDCTLARVTGNTLQATCSSSYSKRPQQQSFSVLGMRSRVHYKDKEKSSDSVRAAPSSECVVDIEPRQSELLPESWDPLELEDAAIERELRRLRPERATLASIVRNKPTSVHRQRSRVLRRKRAHSRRATAAHRAYSIEAITNRRLPLEEQKQWCEALKDWKRVHSVLTSLPNVEDRERRTWSTERDNYDETVWAKAAGLEPSQLQDILRNASTAATVLLASADSTLRRLTKSCRRHGIAEEDILMEAQALWLEAAMQCDFSRASLTTFGTLFVRQRLARTVDAEGSLLQQAQISVYQEALVMKAKRELLEQSDQAPSVKEIADKANLSPKRVEALLKDRKSTISLTTPAQSAEYGEEITLEETISNKAAEGFDENVLTAVQKEYDANLQNVFAANIEDNIDLFICRLRYGFEDGSCHTLEEISKELSVSKEAIRKRLGRAMRQLQQDPKVRQALMLYHADDAFLGSSPV